MISLKLPFCWLPIYRDRYNQKRTRFGLDVKEGNPLGCAHTKFEVPRSQLVEDSQQAIRNISLGSGGRRPRQLRRWNWRTHSGKPCPAGQEETGGNTGLYRVTRDGGATEGNKEESGAWSHGNRRAVGVWLEEIQTSASNAPGTSLRIRIPKRSLAWPLKGHMCPYNGHFGWVVMLACLHPSIYPSILFPLSSWNILSTNNCCAPWILETLL